MAVIIDFKERLEKKTKADIVSLSTFNLTEKDVDIMELYPYIDEQYKVKINTTEGQEKEFIRCQGRRELFNELVRVSKEFESRRVAWIVLERKMGYVYIKELDKIYKEEKTVFVKEIKRHMYNYAIDYLMILEKVSIDTYRWVAV